VSHGGSGGLELPSQRQHPAFGLEVVSDAPLRQGHCPVHVPFHLVDVIGGGRLEPFEIFDPERGQLMHDSGISGINVTANREYSTALRSDYRATSRPY
jgi:hypothetical protein